MTDLLDLVPSMERQMKTYKNEADTDSKLAGYLADAVEALGYFWTAEHTYMINFTKPSTYTTTPDIYPNDKRPIVLMASIIYKMGNMNLAGFTDGDFSYQPFPRGQGTGALSIEVAELDKFLPKNRLAKASTMPLRGFNNVFNIESYDWTAVFALFRF